MQYTLEMNCTLIKFCLLFSFTAFLSSHKHFDVIINKRFAELFSNAIGIYKGNRLYWINHLILNFVALMGSYKLKDTINIKRKSDYNNK